jgi:hypothetical protein
VLKVLEVGFGEELLTRSASPILPCLKANSYESSQAIGRLSQRAREAQTGPALLPLPLGEGWGEGRDILTSLSRATI